MRDQLGIFVGETWAMDPASLHALCARVESAMPALEARLPLSIQSEPTSLSVIDGVATIGVRGPIMKSVNPWLKYFGVEATSSADTRRLLAEANARDDVRSIALIVDSPGGTVSGTQELADDVADSSKPVSARVEGMAASAAYWIASQASSITASRASTIGSIGVFAVVVDSSKAADDAGIKVNVISTSPLKGIGVDGAPVSDDQRAEIQRGVDDIGAMFFDSVARGRNMSGEQVASVATGQMWLAERAVGLGLIDSVDSRERNKVIGIEITAAAAASNEEMSMDPKEIENERLRSEIAALKAQADTADAEKVRAEARALAAEANQRAALIAQYRDRIAPSAMEGISRAVDSYGSDLAAAKSFLDSLEPVARPERESNSGATTEIVARTYSDEERSLAKTFGQSHARCADMRAIGDAVDHVEWERVVADNGRVTMEPRAVLRDGAVLTKTALRAKLGLKGAAIAIALAFSTLLSSGAGATALTAARATECRAWTGSSKSYLMTASKTIYAGSLVMITSAGTAEAAAASASNHGVVGVAQSTKTSASSGSYYMTVSDGVLCKFAGDTLGQDDVGALVYADDDQTIDETQASNAPVAGVLLQYDSASVGWVLVSSAINTARVSVATDPVSLTASLTLENGGVVANDVDGEIQLGDASEDVSFGFGTSNEVTVTTDTGVTRVDFESIGVRTLTPLMMVESQYFCGQGANATTAVYMGPVLENVADNMTTYVFGAAGCDGLESTTEGTADYPLVTHVGALKVMGMVCSISICGTDDVYTFQGRSAAADITGLTCNVTLDGAALKSCSVVLDAPVTVAAGATLAVKNVAATDDNASSCDTECRMFFSY